MTKRSVTEVRQRFPERRVAFVLAVSKADGTRHVYSARKDVGQLLADCRHLLLTLLAPDTDSEERRVAALDAIYEVLGE